MPEGKGGMVALVIVGDGSANRGAAQAAAARAPDLARRRFTEYFARL